MFRFLVLPAGLLGFFYRLSPSDVALGAFMFASIVGVVGGWIACGLSSVQEQEQSSSARRWTSVAVNVLGPPVVLWLSLHTGKHYVVSTIWVTFYYVGIQWLTSNKLTLLSLCVGYLSYVGLLTGIFKPLPGQFLLASATFVLVSLLASLVLHIASGLRESSSP